MVNWWTCFVLFIKKEGVIKMIKPLLNRIDRKAQRNQGMKWCREYTKEVWPEKYGKLTFRQK